MKLQPCQVFERLHEVMDQEVQTKIFVENKTSDEAINWFLNRMLAFQVSCSALTFMSEKKCIENAMELELIRREVGELMIERISSLAERVKGRA